MIEFYTEEYLPGFSGAKRSVLNKQLLETIKRGEFIAASTLSVANDLLSLVWDEYQKYGTEGTALPEADIVLAQKTLVSVLNRLTIPIDIPWRDFSTFRTYWVRHGASGSWQARREILLDLFAPVQKELDRREALQEKGVSALPITSHKNLGWEIVDTKLDALRVRFANAQTSEDYSDVGNRAMAVFEALGDAVTDTLRDQEEGLDFIPRGETKRRFDRYIERFAVGSEEARLRKLVRSAIEFSQDVKHSENTPRRNAGMAADSVILVSHLLRRLNQNI